MKTLSASATITISNIAKQKKAKGEKVYNFAAGDPILTNHPSITNKAIQHTESRLCPYPPIEGVPELRKLMANWINQEYGTNYAQENTLVTCGGKFALFAILSCLVNIGDEVLIPAPYWVSYPGMVEMVNGVPTIIPTVAEKGWKISANDLLQYVSKKSKILILNNASNPTGSLYSRDELHDILMAAKKAGLIVISDEVYSGLIYNDSKFASCGSFPEFSENVVVVQSCSKNFGMTGWRVGFAMGSPKLIKELTIFQGQTTTGTSLISQWAAVGALENASEVNSYVKKAMKERRDLFQQTFDSLFEVPLNPIDSALYAFVPLSSMGIRHTTDSAKVCEELISSANIALVPGTAFGTEGYVRFAFSETLEDIEQGLQLLKKAVKS